MQARTPTSQKQTGSDKKKILTVALKRAQERLGISRQELSVIIGLSESSLSRAFTKPDYPIDPASNEGRLALLLLHLYRSLDTLFGGNAKQCQLWLRTQNSHLNGIPVLLIQSIDGLVMTVHYLDIMQGKS